MALSDLTKQLAQQAMGNPVKNVLEALRPADASQISETVRAGKPPAPPGEEHGAVVLAQVQAMQKALKDDEELVVLVSHGAETIRVFEFFLPSWQVAVLSGIDADRNITRVVVPVESMQLICKVMKVQPPARPARIGFVAPKPKPR